MLILPELDCNIIAMASSMELKCVQKTFDCAPPEPKEIADIKSSPSHPSAGLELQTKTSSLPQQRQHQIKEFRYPQHQLRQPHHNWDINDSTLPTPEVHDPFDLWPVGHCRRMYRWDIDDARRHISGWAMRNTNNHNALILKKSCLGVLICSNDCVLENGKKINFRPAICDKARRKQIGKPCPNPGCCGKLTLLPCRGHCGYPVTHFWRQVKGSVFFQAKGYHDHPRPDVKSLSEKGRNALLKQTKHNFTSVVTNSNKRRHSSLSHDIVPSKKINLKEKEVMCSCPPFECNCKQFQGNKKFRNLSHPSNLSQFNTVVHPSSHFPLESVHSGSVTQINITNTCLPHTNLGFNVPYSQNTFPPPNSRILQPNALPEDNQFGRNDCCVVPYSSEATIPQSNTHYRFDDFKSRHSHLSYSEFQTGTRDMSCIQHETFFPVNSNERLKNNSSTFERFESQRTQTQFAHLREIPDIRTSSNSEHCAKGDPFQPNFLLPYSISQHDIRFPMENTDLTEESVHRNESLLPDFNVLNFCSSPEPHTSQQQSIHSDRESRTENLVCSQSSEKQEIVQHENRSHLEHVHRQEMNEPTFITLTSPDKRNYDPASCSIQNDMAVHSVPCSVGNIPSSLHEHTFNYNKTASDNSRSPSHLERPTTATESTLTNLGNAAIEAPMLPLHNSGVSSEMSHVPEMSAPNLLCSNVMSLPSSHQIMSTTSAGQYAVPDQTPVDSFHHGIQNTYAQSNIGYNQFYTDAYQSPSAHPQHIQYPQQMPHQQHPHSRNSINITLTYN